MRVSYREQLQPAEYLHSIVNDICDIFWEERTLCVVLIAMRGNRLSLGVILPLGCLHQIAVYLWIVA